MNASVNSQLSPRRARGFGAADPFASAKALLAGSMSGPISAGDAMLFANNYSGAVASYKLAGTAGAEPHGVGAVIVAAGGNAGLVSQASAANGLLQALDSTPSIGGPTMADATSAQSFAKTMVGLYQQAMVTTTTSTGPIKATPPVTPAPSTSKTTMYVVGGVAVAALGAGGWWLYGRKKR